MKQKLLRYMGFALTAVIFGAGGGYLAVNQSGTIPAIPAKPIPGQGIPAEPATPKVEGSFS